MPKVTASEAFERGKPDGARSIGLLPIALESYRHAQRNDLNFQPFRCWRRASLASLAGLPPPKRATGLFGRHHSVKPTWTLSTPCGNFRASFLPRVSSF